jgi:DNA-binding GntR family transcriptional regulator
VDDVVNDKRRARADAAVEALDVLRERIANHDLPPGSKLRETEVSTEFGISRARVRELFGTLADRGLIERIPNRGAVVRRLDLADAFALYDVREVLEGLSTRLATEKADPESWQDLIDLFGGLKDSDMTETELMAYWDAVDRVRGRTVEAADNPLLSDILDGIYDRTKVVTRRIVALPGRAEEGIQEQRQILAAMRRGDASEAERLKCENIRSARDTLQRYEAFVL